MLNQRHAVQVSFSPPCGRARKVARLAMKEPPMALSAISRTAGLPSRLPKTPFTKAPSAGSASTTASSVKFDAANCVFNASTLVPQQIGLVGPDRLLEPEEGEHDGEPQRGLGRGHGDDEEGEDLPP